MQAPHVSVMLRSWDVRTGVSADMTLEAARRAEALGLDGILAGDHVTFYGYGNDGLVTLTAIAAVTERIELKTAVYLLPLRHPVPVALNVAQLHQLSLGRFILGVGIGGEDPHEFLSCGIDPRTRGARANEALQILPRLWTEDGVSFQGKHFQLEDVTVYPKPLGPVRIYIGGRSDAALVRAGRYGDGYTGIWQSVERFRQAQEIARDAASETGRDPDALQFGMQFWMGVDDSSPAALDRVSAGMEAMYHVPFGRFEKYTPYGTAREVAERMLPWIEAGATHLNLLPVEPSPGEVVERAAEVRQALHELLA